MRSYSFKSLASRIVTWALVLGITLGSLPSATVLQAVPSGSNTAPQVQASGSNKARIQLKDYNNAKLEPGTAPIGPGLKDSKGTIAVMLELLDDPVVVTQYAKQGKGKNLPAQAQVAAAQKSLIEAAQTQTLGALKSAVAGSTFTLLYQVKNVYNGIAILVDAKYVPQLAKLPGVKALHRIQPFQRTNAYSDQLIKAPTAWYPSVNITGTGVKIGIIDSGIDYIHTNFGGRGLQTDYDYAHTVTGGTVVKDSVQIYPTPKVAGGYDFAGDAYTGSNTPQPDSNPLDCSANQGGGHGSHVAGTAAGYGVNADGTTYTGPYDNSTPFDIMKIGPGVAPGATLYALRVFGCSGDTLLTTRAIDWAVDPDGNPGTNDKLDIINMSLGTPFGVADDPAADASNNAALAGVTVVVSAGDNGDVYYINGTPASAQRALTVANSADGVSITDGFLVTDPAGSGNISGIKPAARSTAYPWETQNPVSVTVPVTAPLYYPTSNQSGCDPFDNTEAANIDGMILVLDWANALGSTDFPCDAVVRGANAVAANAKGVIIVSGVPYLDASINGPAVIPAFFTTSTVGDELKTRLTAGVPSDVLATLTIEYFNSQRIVFEDQNDMIDPTTSRGPQGFGNALKPDIAAPGTTIFSTRSGSGTKGQSMSGTSMAAPHLSGLMALLHQKFPGWTVEEYKAAAMNTADQDLFTDYNHTGIRYGQSRVGAGRVNVATAISNTVLAFNADNIGAVSLSFGLVEVTSTLTLVKHIKVENKSNLPQSYDLSYDPYLDIPGVDYTFPDGPTVLVPANGEVTFSVQLNADASLMTHSSDPSGQLLQLNTYFRNYISEESGIIKLTPLVPTTNTLRVPVYAIARPASEMRASSGLDFSNGDTVPLNLIGTGIDQSGADSVPTATVSLVTPLELVKASSKLNLPNDPPTTTNRTVAADLEYIGISSNFNAVASPADTQIFFGISTWANWTSASNYDVEFDIYVDTNRDGTNDYLLYNAPVKEGATFSDLVAVTVVNLSTNATSSTTGNFIDGLDGQIDLNLFNSNVMVLPVGAYQLGLDMNTADTGFNYSIFTYDHYRNQLVDNEGPFFYDAGRPGLNFHADSSLSAFSPELPFFRDLPSTLTDVTFNVANYTRNGSKGVLLLHQHNANGRRAEVVAVSNNVACLAIDATVVSVETDDGSGTVCGTLSYALSTASGTLTHTITFNLPGGNHLITFTGNTPVNVPANVVLQGISGSCGTANNLVLQNSSAPQSYGQLLVLNGGDGLNGITLKGIRLVAQTSAAGHGPNKIKCVQIQPYP